VALKLVGLGTISALLLDPEATANDEGGEDQPTDGHLQEPALFIPAMVRAFGGTMNDQNYYAYDLVGLGQDIFDPPSVFNYYSPSYGVPGTTLLGGLYLPTLLTAFYNEAKSGPCPLRFQIAAEAGWDIGATIVCLMAAALCASGAPLQATIALAVPLVVVQALLLQRSYAKTSLHRAATGYG